MTNNNDNQILIDGQNKDALIITEPLEVALMESGLVSWHPKFNYLLVSGVVSIELMPKFFGENRVKTWQQKIHFFFTTRNLDKYLKEDAPVLPSRNTDPLVLTSVDTWTHSDFMCQGWILSRLIDLLYDVYSKVTSSIKTFGMYWRKSLSLRMQTVRNSLYQNFKTLKWWIQNLSWNKWKCCNCLRMI